MWDLPRPGLEPVSPALAGGFLTTVPPGKPPWPSLEEEEFHPPGLLLPGGQVNSMIGLSLFSA